MKQLLVFFTSIYVFLPVVQAEEKSWYEIDGIKIRSGHNANRTVLKMPWEGDREIIETRGALVLPPKSGPPASMGN